MQALTRAPELDPDKTEASRLLGIVRWDGFELESAFCSDFVFIGVR